MTVEQIIQLIREQIDAIWQQEQEADRLYSNPKDEGEREQARITSRCRTKQRVLLYRILDKIKAQA